MTQKMLVGAFAILLLLLVWPLASGGGLVPAPSVRAEEERAVGRARYRFLIGATRPFDEVYPTLAFREAGRARTGR